MAYKNIHDQFWTDPKLKKLSPNDKYLFVYLITSPHSHYTGLYYLPILFIKEETGLGGAVDRGMKGLGGGDLVRYDEERNIVFVVNMMKHQTQGCSLNLNQKKGVVAHLKRLHNSPLIQDFLDKYGFIGFDYSYTPIDTPIDTPMGWSPDTDTDTDTDTDFDYVSAFTVFWEVYPKRNGRRVGKEVSFRLFKKIHPADMPDLLGATQNYAKESKGYAKDPERFFKNDHWRSYIENPDIGDLSPEGQAAMSNIQDWLKENEDVEK